MKVFINPYRYGIGSVKRLKNLLPEIVVMRPHQSKAKIRESDIIINWGRSNFNNLKIEYWNCLFTELNRPGDVFQCSNKLAFFRWARGLDDSALFIDSTECPIQAEKWILEGDSAVMRHSLTGHSGEGIEIVSKPQNLDSECQLFTRYFPKKEEYRIHFFKGRIIFQQRKSIKRGSTPIDWKIRNKKNGFFFQVNNFELPNAVLTTAKRFLALVPLDFGAIDILYNQRGDIAKVCEVNSAPNLNSSALEAYANEFRKFIDDRSGTNAETN